MRLSAVEQTISKHSRMLFLDSIRNRILVFAVLATLIPSLSTTWLSYSQNRRALNDNRNQRRALGNRIPGRARASSFSRLVDGRFRQGSGRI